MATLNSGSASPKHPSEMTTFADKHEGRHELPNRSYRRSRSDRDRTEDRVAAVGDVPRSKQQHPLHPKIYIHLGNPGIYSTHQITGAYLGDDSKVKMLDHRCIFS